MPTAPLPMSPGSARAITDSLDEVVAGEVLEMFARGLPEGLGGGFVTLAIATTLLQLLAAPRYLAAWAAVVAMVLGTGLWLAWAYRKRPRGRVDTRCWRRIFLLLITISGLTWGAAGWLFVPAPWQAEMVVIGMLALLSAGILGHTGANLGYYFAVVAAALLPTVAWRLRLGGTLNLGMAAAVAMLLLGLSLFAARLAAATRSALRTGHENQRLAAALAQRTRDAEQANLAKSRFIAAASHDLRQPVHALGLLLDLLQGQALGNDARATAQRMARVFGSLNSLFDSLLDISKLDSGAVQPQWAEFALAPLLNDLVDEFGAEAQAKGLRLRCHAGDARVRTDPLLLERMLRNLLANAVRYTERGGIVVGCRRRGRMVRIEVWDSGIGIAAAEQQAVFGEFVQVGHPEGRTAGQGLGLGLAITRRLGALLEHPIDLRSRPGRGSVFGVGVPLAAAAAESVAAAAPDAQACIAAPLPWHARSVWVVDDDPLARDAIVRWLEGWGCTVSAGASAEAALTFASTAAAPPDALISDWRLPGDRDGLAVIALLRKELGEALPAILVTGDAVNEVRRLAQDSRVLLLRKPVRPAALRAALASSWQATTLAEDAAR